MVRYYSNIVGKYGIPVQNAFEEVGWRGAGLHLLNPWSGLARACIEKVIGMYDKMSKYERRSQTLVICYGTMYGNTERMAEIIARSANKAGVKNIVMYNISKTHHSYILRDIFRYKGLIVGAPTYNAGLYHEMEVLLSSLPIRTSRTTSLAGMVLIAGQARLWQRFRSGTTPSSTTSQWANL